MKCVISLPLFPIENADRIEFFPLVAIPYQWRRAPDILEDAMLARFFDNEHEGID
jgi:hypothetical protein